MVKRFLDILGWVGTALVFAALAMMIWHPPQWDLDRWNQYKQWVAIAGLICVLLYMTTQWRDLATFYRGRSARYGTLSIVSVIVALAIVVAVNYLGVRRNKRWDLTENQIYSLSDQSKKILQTLDAPVKLTVFARSDDFDAFRDRLDEYAYNSNNKVSVEYVDADRQPGRAKAAAIQTYGTVLIEYKTRTERVTGEGGGLQVRPPEEQALTNGIIKAVTGTERKVYFTQGHGEKDTSSQDRTGYSAIAQQLQHDNYGVAPLVLVQQREVPADAAAVVLAGPRNDFLQPEIDALKKYVAKGGKVMVMLDPPERLGENSTPLLTAFLKEWGVDAGNDIVVDASGIGQLIGTDASVPVAAPPYPSHTITDRFSMMTAFPLARSMRPAEGGTHTAQPFVQTSPQSWAETDLKSIASGGQVSFEADKGDKQGPVPLATASSAPATDVPPPLPTNNTANAPPEPPKPESRVVAFGDSDFAANYALGVQGNRDLFMNALNWVAQQENLIAVRPREPQDRRVTLTADQNRGVMLMSLLFIPAMVFGAGVYTWWRRR